MDSKIFKERVKDQLYLEIDGNLYLFGDPIGLENFSHNDKRTFQQPEGKSLVEAHQKGADCRVEVNGKEVFRTKLLGGVKLLGAVPFQDKLRMDKIERSRKYQKGAHYEVYPFSAGKIIHQLIKPDKRDQQILGAHFNLTKEESLRLFPKEFYDSYHKHHIMKFSNLHGTQPFTFDVKRLKGDSSSLDLYTQNSGSEPITLLLDQSQSSLWKSYEFSYNSKIQMNLKISWNEDWTRARILTTQYLDFELTTQ